MYFVGVTSDLTKPLEFRPIKGRNFSDPVALLDGRRVRVLVNEQADKDQPLEVAVVDENQKTLVRAFMLNNTTQIFSKIGLLINVTQSPGG